MNRPIAYTDLTPDEQEFLDWYRKQDPAMKKAAHELLALWNNDKGPSNDVADCTAWLTCRAAEIRAQGGTA